MANATIELQDIKTGDIVVIRSDNPEDISLASDALFETLKRRGVEDVLFVHLRPGVSFETVTLEDMATLGWHRNDA